MTILKLSGETEGEAAADLVIIASLSEDGVTVNFPGEASLRDVEGLAALTLKVSMAWNEFRERYEGGGDAPLARPANGDIVDDSNGNSYFRWPGAQAPVTLE